MCSCAPNDIYPLDQYWEIVQCPKEEHAHQKKEYLFNDPQMDQTRTSSSLIWV